LFSGLHDALSDPIDVTALVSLLPTPPIIWNIQNQYTHMDFVWGEDASTKIYPTIMNLIKQYGKQ